MYASKAVRRLELETKTLTVVVTNNILKTPWPKNRINPLVSTISIFDPCNKKLRRNGQDFSDE